LLTLFITKSSSAQESCNVKSYGAVNCVCNEMSNKIKFCASVSQVPAEKGYTIVLNTLIKNLSDKNIKVSMIEGFYEQYKIDIRNSDGKKILSYEELKLEENQNSNSNEITSIPTISLRSDRFKEVSPQGEFKSECNLSDFYKFEKGKYQIEISRKLPNWKESDAEYLSAGIIEIEIE
jgi:hypothetical protein